MSGFILYKSIRLQWIRSKQKLHLHRGSLKKHPWESSSLNFWDVSVSTTPSWSLLQSGLWWYCTVQLRRMLISDITLCQQEKNIKLIQMSITEKFQVGKRRNHWAVWELHHGCLWGQICIPFKMCLISYCFPRLEADIRNLFLYQLRSLIVYLQSYFINDRKGEK